MSTVVECSPFIEQLGAMIDRKFNELPGLRLTGPQIRRRWALSEAECAAVLEYLTMALHLVQDHSGQYTLVDRD